MKDAEVAAGLKAILELSADGHAVQSSDLRRLADLLDGVDVDADDDAQTEEIAAERGPRSLSGPVVSVPEGYAHAMIQEELPIPGDHGPTAAERLVQMAQEPRVVELAGDLPLPGDELVLTQEQVARIRAAQPRVETEWAGGLPVPQA